MNRPIDEWYKGARQGRWRNKADPDIDIMIHGDSTFIYHDQDSKALRDNLLRLVLKDMSGGCHSRMQGGADLGGICDTFKLPEQNNTDFSNPNHFGRTGQRVRVVAWSGNKLTTKGTRRLVGTGPGEDGNRFLEMEQKVFGEVLRLVDLQMMYATTQGTYMVVLGLGDASSWGIPRAEGAHAAFNALASKAAALANNRMLYWDHKGFPCKMLWVRGSELYKRGEHPAGDVWHFLPTLKSRVGNAFVDDCADYVQTACELCIELNQDPHDSLCGTRGTASAVTPGAPPPPTEPVPKVHCLVDRVTINGSAIKGDLGPILPFHMSVAPTIPNLEYVDVDSREHREWMQAKGLPRTAPW